MKFGTKRKDRKLRGLNQIIVGTDRRHELRTFNGMSYEITDTGPLSICPDLNYCNNKRKEFYNRKSTWMNNQTFLG